MNAVTGVFKNIQISAPIPDVVNFVVMVEEDEFGVSKKVIKWSVRNGQSDLFFMIDSINPIRVFGGIAAISDFAIHSILAETEEEVVEFAKNMDVDTMVKLMKESYFIGYKDQKELMKPPGMEIVLYEPSEEEVKERERLLSVFYNCLAN